MTRTQLTKLQFDYMDSLVQIEEVKAFDNAIRSFIIDLVEEGFDLNQVRQYMKEREERIFFEFRGYDNDQD
jgi:hypothetical protein